MDNIQRFVSFLLLFLGSSLTSFASREEVVHSIALQARCILPDNWFLVHTDSSLTIYFCETAMDMSVTDSNSRVPNQAMYGDQFWGAPLPDSVYVPELVNHWIGKSKYVSDSKKPKKQVNAILRIDIMVGHYNSSKSEVYYDQHPVWVINSVPTAYSILFTEKRAPIDRYYRENGLTLKNEYIRLLLNVKFMLGFKNSD